jgi:hypothetical protein
MRSIGSDGNTNQNVDCDSAAIPSLSEVSRHSQMKARIDVSGNDRMTAPSAGLRLATSEAVAMMTPERRAFIAAYSMPISDGEVAMEPGPRSPYTS